MFQADSSKDQQLASEPTPWLNFLAEAKRRVAAARATLPPGIDIRCEGDGDAGGAGGGDGNGDGDGGGSGKDGGEGGGNKLSDPVVQKAIQTAVAREREAAAEREAGLKENRDALLSEKKRYSSLGDPDELAAKLEKLEKLETKLKAEAAGSDPEKFEAAVERAAEEKYRQREKALSGVMEEKDHKITELTEALEEAKAAKHRAFVAEQLLRASMPQDKKIIHDGAHDFVIDTLAPLVVPHEIDGVPGVHARLRVNDVLVPGSGKDGLMDLREVLDLARQGKGPVPTVGFCLVDNGSGSGTRPSNNGSTPPAGGNWNEMSEEQRTAYIREHGSAAAHKLIDAAATAEG